MTTKEFLKLMERAKKEAYEMYKEKGDYFTLKDIEIIVGRAKQEEDLFYQRKLNKIREEIYEYNRDIGYYDIAGMNYDEFLKAMKEYSYEDQMKLAYAFFQHIKTLDNMVFDEEGEE